jgi:cell division protein FtsB
MQDYRKRRTTKQDALRAGLGLGGVLLLALVAYFAVKGAWGMYGKFAAASQADADAKQELSDLQGQYAQVGASVDALSSDRGVEAGVRERYGVARPGEGQIDIIRREATTSDATPGEPNIFVRIFRALFVW